MKIVSIGIQLNVTNQRNESMSDIKGMGISKEETEEDTELFFKNSNFVHFVGMIAPPRPGVRLCITKLEHEHYPPGSDLNNDFFMRLRKWEDILWAIVSIPKNDIEIMQNVAKETGLKIADGLPCIISSGKMKRFPIKNSKNVFTLENSTDHPIHKRKIAFKDIPKTIKEMEIEEDIEIEKIFAEIDKKNRE